HCAVRQDHSGRCEPGLDADQLARRQGPKLCGGDKAVLQERGSRHLATDPGRAHRHADRGHGGRAGLRLHH
ncbi:hypothetical protein EC988_010438, partial [Linderina pennispora]